MHTVNSAKDDQLDGQDIALEPFRDVEGEVRYRLMLNPLLLRQLLESQVPEALHEAELVNPSGSEADDIKSLCPEL